MNKLRTIFGIIFILMFSQVVYAGGTVTNCTTEGAIGTPGTLRDALNGGGTVTFACSGTINVTNSGGADIVTTSTTTIDATGQSVTIRGSGTTRIFLSGVGTDLTLINLIIENGNVAAAGGGIAHVGNTLNIINSTFINNQATGGGGAIENNTGRTVNITDSTIQNNTASTGGGIYNIGGTVNLNGCTLVINNTPDDIVDVSGGITNDNTDLSTCATASVPTSNRCPVFFDGRINDCDTGNWIVIFGHDYGSGRGLLITDTEGNNLLQISPEQIAGVVECPDSNTLIASGGGVSVYRLAGTCNYQVNGSAADGKTYVVIFDELYANSGYTSHEE